MDINIQVDKLSIESIKSIESPMYINELHGDIRELMLKYSSGTMINNLTVEQFQWVNNLILEIMKNPRNIF